MSHRPINHSTRFLSLTEEEAVALLEICLHTKADDDALKAQVMEKVGELCREFIKSGDHGLPAQGIRADRLPVRDALDALLHRRSVKERVSA